MKKAARKLMSVFVALALTLGSFLNTQALSEAPVETRPSQVAQAALGMGTRAARAPVSMSLPAATPAFPGAEGFGSSTVGGRFGKVIFVTNLNDGGSGSLREALNASGARIVIFKVGGIIKAQSILYVHNPYITIAGQTAPGNGIVIQGSPIFIRTHDVIVRGMKFRIGDGSVGAKAEDRDGITLYGDYGHEVYNVIVDHNSVAWAVDENMSTWDDSRVGLVHDVTFSWNISTEALNCSIHPGGCHAMGLLIGEMSKNVSLHHNLIASNMDRNPRLAGGTSGELINNVVYNWDSGATDITSYAYGGAMYPDVNWNVIGNYHKETANSNEIQNVKRGINIQCDTTGKVYLKGNVGYSRRTDTDDEWLAVTFFCPNTAIRSSVSVVSSGMGIQPVAQAYEDVLSCAGAVPRDTVDTRAVTTTRNGTSPIANKWLVDSPAEVGGMPSYPAGVAPADTDNDGMPDAWESANGTNPNIADGNAVGANGYTNIENYMNSFFAGTAVPVTPTPITPKFTQPATSIPTATSSFTPTQTPSPSRSPVPTATYTASFTGTSTSTQTPTRTASPTGTSTHWPTYTATATKTSSPNPTSTPASSSFVDVPTDHWAYRYIQALFNAGYVAGCESNPRKYCPEAPMTRAHGAVFVVRGLRGGGYIPPGAHQQLFEDVRLDRWYAAWVEPLFEAGFTSGCSVAPRLFCPDQGHTRAEAAVFFLRMLNGPDYVPPAPQASLFADIPLDRWYAPWVMEAYRRELVPACEAPPGSPATTPQLFFCPDDSMTRATGAYSMVQAKGGLPLGSSTPIP